MTMLATYRIQLNKDFTLHDTGKVASYLKDLNISHIYLSPVWESSLGSTHGYDVSDFTKISTERGGNEAFKDLCKTICSYDEPLKILLDIVPNHMSTGLDNPFWVDVLKRGKKSAHSTLFDLRTSDDSKICIPVLAGNIDDAIEKGELTLTEQDGIPSLKYFDKIFPLNEESIEAYKNKEPIQSILDMQYYQLTEWTSIFKNISYRRFFDVAGLIGVRVEDEENYTKTHKTLFELLKEFNCIDAIRIDHIDGLANPEKYLEKLSKNISAIWVEKILARGEFLPAWPVKGTTGYEFIDHLNQLFIKPANLQKIELYWKEKTRQSYTDFQDCIYECKAKILKDLFSPELQRLCNLSAEPEDMEQAKIFWSGLIIALGVYRTYGGMSSESDKIWIEQALKQAEELFGPDFVKASQKFMPILNSPQTEKHNQVIQEWRQLTGPVMAKGLEDTAHYRYVPLAALNEVGCCPKIEESSKDDFFKWIGQRAKEWPEALNTTSTHDTKRSEDARHRLYALSDMPLKWTEFFDKASALDLQTNLDSGTKYFLYQALVATWPLDHKVDDAYIKRIKDYMLKAMRESRIHTDWISPQKEYEDLFNAYIDAILSNKDFLSLIHDLAEPVMAAGALTSLSVQTLKILNPGIPDIYQGTELWDYSLVDPDNRRSVDYSIRKNLLSSKQDHDLINHLKITWKTGHIKLWLTQKLLEIRKNHIQPLSLPLNIESLKTEGRYVDNLIAYKITGEDRKSGLIVLCPRYCGEFNATENLEIDWQDTSVANTSFHKLHDLILDRPIDSVSSVGDLLRTFPISVISFE